MALDKLQFALSTDGDWPPVSTESVWCERDGAGYKLVNAPFFISGLAHLDTFVAETDPVSGLIHRFSVTKDSGHSLVWMINNTNRSVEKVKASFESLGCRLEGLEQFSLYAIDVPAAVSGEAVDSAIAEAEASGLDFAFPVWRHGAGA